MPHPRTGQPAAAASVPRFRAAPSPDHDENIDEVDENIFLLWPNIIGKPSNPPLKL